MLWRDRELPTQPVANSFSIEKSARTSKAVWMENVQPDTEFSESQLLQETQSPNTPSSSAKSHVPTWLSGKTYAYSRGSRSRSRAEGARFPNLTGAGEEGRCCRGFKPPCSSITEEAVGALLVGTSQTR